MSTPTRPLTQMETRLSLQAPLEERRQTLTELKEGDRPDPDTIAAVVTLLHDEDPDLKEMAATLLRYWGQPAITMLLQALRSTEPLDIPQRLTLIQFLASLGQDALRAETLLHSLENDAHVGAEAAAAIRIIRADGYDLLCRFGDWGVELLLLSAAVGIPMASMRLAQPQVVWPPLGLVVGFGALAVAGLMLARYVYSGDLLPDREPGAVVATKRRMNYAGVAILGAVAGAALTGVLCACGPMAQRLFGP
jgi:hypothetical protein